MRPNSIYMYIVAILLAQFFTGHVIAEVYHWKDKDGNVIFSDKPQSDDAKPVKINPENKQGASANSNKQPAKSVQQIADEMEAARLEREMKRKPSPGQRANEGQCISTQNEIDSLRKKIKKNEVTYDRFNHSRYRETKKMKKNLQELQSDYDNYCR